MSISLPFDIKTTEYQRDGRTIIEDIACDEEHEHRVGIGLSKSLVSDVVCMVVG